MKRIFLILVACAILFAIAQQCFAQSVSQQFCSAIRQRCGNRMRWYTIVPYKERYFGSSCTASAQELNSGPPNARWAIWEYVRGRWSCIFEFPAEVDADEGSEHLNRLFARYQFSPDMRIKLMYGIQKPL